MTQEESSQIWRWFVKGLLCIELAIVLVEELFPLVTKQMINDVGNSDHPVYVSPSKTNACTKVHYRPQTKFWEGNVSPASVCPQGG